MRKRIFTLMLLTVFLCSALLCGCGKADGGPTLPKLDYDRSTLTGTVEYVNGQACRIQITEGDSHYDPEDYIYLNFSAIDGGKAVKVGDTVSFTYHYTTDVSEYNGDPAVTVRQVTVS